jgi:hypothetical protein
MLNSSFRLRMLPRQFAARTLASTSTAQSQIAVMAKRVLQAAGKPSLRRIEHGQGIAKDESTMEAGVRAVLGAFDEARNSGMHVCTRETVSMVVRVCCVPNSSWQRRELPRALHLFQRTRERPPPEYVQLADTQKLGARARPRYRMKPPLFLRLAVESHGGEPTAAEPAAAAELEEDADDEAAEAAAEDAPRAFTACEHAGCERPARYGCARNGFARACGEHAAEGQARVDLDPMAQWALAESLVAEALVGDGDAALLGHAAGVYASLLATQEKQPHRMLAPLRRLFHACLQRESNSQFPGPAHPAR